ncbi:uncharacterized protein LOC124171555 [Ischnura elegans]|uniref:uncharacterized protein LOC124158090 n=1 Tax=Ischnura elegans TaxID=197161 RepID=UPI001ED89203|nr:uncharacterized protein LOC124158090 [Ischnura elegans]XP_046406685.1 uncharacterized protein LOC124171555 [Ischnura elegans]
MNVDRRRVIERLRSDESSRAALNSRGRDTQQYSIGDFVLLHRASKLHASKADFEFLGPYEVREVTPEGRYELKRVGATRQRIVKAAKEQLRPWPKDWSAATDIPRAAAVPRA